LEPIEYQTVILAAFLHDIGKLLGRGDFKILDKGQHPGFSSTSISAHKSIFSKVADISLLRELVQKHHENSRAFPAEFLVQSIEDDHTRTLATLVRKGCRESIEAPLIRMALENAGIPVLPIYADNVDPRDWDDAKMKSLVSEFIERRLSN
jgi:hypothetical protein